jgi:hypothetical protein
VGYHRFITELLHEFAWKTGSGISSGYDSDLFHTAKILDTLNTLVKPKCSKGKESSHPTRYEFGEFPLISVGCQQKMEAVKYKENAMDPAGIAYQ